MLTIVTLALAEIFSTCEEAIATAAMFTVGILMILAYFAPATLLDVLKIIL